MTKKNKPVPQALVLKRQTPPTALKKFAESMKRMNELYVELTPLLIESKELQVVSAAEFTRASEIIVLKKKAIKESIAAMQPHKELINNIHDFIQEELNSFDSMGKSIIDILAPRMKYFEDREKLAAAAEEKRLQSLALAELERQAELKRQDDQSLAKTLKLKRVDEIRQDLRDKKITLKESKVLLEQAGAVEEAAFVQAKVDELAAKERAPEVAASIEVEPGTPHVYGIVNRTNWKFRIKDPQKVNMRWLCPDEKRIGEYVRDVKDAKVAELEVGGIEVYTEKSY